MFWKKKKTKVKLELSNEALNRIKILANLNNKSIDEVIERIVKTDLKHLDK